MGRRGRGFFAGAASLGAALRMLRSHSELWIWCALLFTMLFLPLDYTGYLLDRRDVPFCTRRGWVWRHRRAMLGFGAAALGTFLVPGLNFLCLPWLVTAGTLLALDVRVPEPCEVSETD